MLASARDWLTLEQIQGRTVWAKPPNGWQVTSISARIRSIRAHGFRIDLKRKGDPKSGLWVYKLVTEEGE